VAVTADLPNGGKFKLDGTAGPVDEADTALTPLDAKLNVTGLDLASTGFLDSSAGLGGDRGSRGQSLLKKVEKAKPKATSNFPRRF